MQNNKTLLWIARSLIATVLISNIQCAVSFLIQPNLYAPSFELQGTVGNAVIRSLGILFIMWNVPYIFALFNPIKYIVSLYEANVMQAIGLIGEILLSTTIPTINNLLANSIERFIYFDGAGLGLLLISLIIIKKYT